MINDRTLARALRYLNRIEFHSSKVQGELMYIKELLNEQRTSEHARKIASKNASVSFKDHWNRNKLSQTLGKTSKENKE